MSPRDRFRLGVLTMRAVRTVLTVLYWLGVVVSSLLLAIHLQASGLLFVVEVAGLSILLSLVLLTILVATARIIRRRDLTKKDATASFESGIIKDFIKLAVLGLSVGGVLYLLWLIFAPERLSTPRVMFILMSFVCLATAFADGVARLLVIGGYLPDSVSERFTLTANEIRAIRGRFREKKSNWLGTRVLAVCFGVILPLVFITCIFEASSVGNSSQADTLTCLVLVPICVGLGTFLWLAFDGEWEFTGEEIIARRGKPIHWRIPIDSITRAEVTKSPQRVAFLDVFTSTRHYSIHAVPELLDSLRQAGENRRFTIPPGIGR
jgi:hypothetical protein